MLRSIVISLAALTVVLGGAKVRGVIQDKLASRPAAAAQGPRALPPELHGGGRDLRPRVIQASLFSGSTHVGLSPEVLFHVRNASAATIQPLAAKLEAGARFTDRQGRTTAAVAAFTPSQVPSFNYELTLAPLALLQQDEWYTLTIDHDASMVVGSHEDAMTDDPQASRQIRLFTGSAPQIRRVVQSRDPRKPVVQIDVILSEPVQLGTLAAEGFEAEADGQRLEGCVAWEQGCVASAQRGLSNAFSYRLSAPAQHLAPKHLALALEGSARGAARSVAEGSAVTGVGLDTYHGRQRLVTAINAAQWHSCSGNNDIQCWRSSDL